MYHYTVIQWMFFFYFYCFFGWCFESLYVSVKSRHPVNRGFMRGPFLPLYGSGAIMMLVVSMPFKDNLFLVYVAGCVGATILEYVTGVIMEALFKVRYWDYSNDRFNFQGHICLGSSLAWGFLTILMTEVMHKPVEKLVLSIPSTALTIVTCILTAGIAADFALSFKAALDLKDVLIKLEQAKEELARIQKRLDVIIAVAGEDIANRREDIAESIEEKLEKLRVLSQTEPGGRLESMREEISELKAGYIRSRDERRRLGDLKDVFQRSLIRSHPSMSSKRFKEALEELKKNSRKK